MPLSRACEDFSRCRKRHILRMGWWRGSFSKEGEGTTIIGPRDSKEGVVIGDRLGGGGRVTEALGKRKCPHRALSYRPDNRASSCLVHGSEAMLKLLALPRCTAPDSAGS